MHITLFYVIAVVNAVNAVTSSFNCTWIDYSFTQEGHRYFINTCGPCQCKSIPILPICHLGPLLRKLAESKETIEVVSRKLQEVAPTPPQVCNADPFNPEEIRSGVSVVDTVKDSYKLLTEVVLRMAIIGNNVHSVMSIDVRRPILDVLCKMRGLLQLVPVEEAMYSAEYEVQLPNRGDVIRFACQNLRRAVSILDHVKNVIRSDMQNPNLPTA